MCAETSPRFRTCIHEAGHAVAATALGFQVRKVWTNSNGSGGTYWEDPSQPGFKWPQDALRVGLAGGEAERWEYGLADRGCWVDDVWALRDAFDIEGDLDRALDLVETVRQEVRNLLFDRWLEVEGVALVLIEHSVLWGEAEIEAARRTYLHERLVAA